MKKRKAMQLVEALRSGEYSQGIGQLVDSADNFCCLGVACNISKADLPWKTYCAGWGMGGQTSILPIAIQKDFGFHSDSGRRRDRKDIIINGRQFKSLANANDRGCTFDQIADYIEEHYEAL